MTVIQLNFVYVLSVHVHVYMKYVLGFQLGWQSAIANGPAVFTTSMLDLQVCSRLPPAFRCIWNLHSGLHDYTANSLNH